MQQRRGRAGRVKPGICYRLVTRRLYESLPEHTLPEISRSPLDSLFLMVKVGVDTRAFSPISWTFLLLQRSTIFLLYGDSQPFPSVHSTRPTVTGTLRRSCRPFSMPHLLPRCAPLSRHFERSKLSRRRILPLLAVAVVHSRAKSFPTRWSSRRWADIWHPFPVTRGWASCSSSAACSE